MSLTNEVDGLRIVSTVIVVEYSDSSSSLVTLTAVLRDYEVPVKVKIHFLLVAELTCKTVNFYESNYKNYSIVDNTGSPESRVSGFFQVQKSDLLASKIHLYDPKNRFGIKHFLVAGNDSYCEVLASKYTIEIEGGS